MENSETKNSAPKPGRTAKLSESSRGSFIVAPSEGARPQQPPTISAPAANKK